VVRIPLSWPRAAAVGVALVSIVTVWQVAHLLISPSKATLLPGPLIVGKSLVHLFAGAIWADLSSTLWQMLLGLTIAVLIGVMVGLLMGLNPRIYDGAAVLVDFVRSVPISSLYPVFVLVAGIGTSSKIAMVAVACLPIIALSSAFGVAHANPLRTRMAKLAGASRFELFWRVSFMEALPHTLQGIRLAISYALIVQVLAEMFMGANLGLGQRLMESYNTYAIDRMYAYIICSGILGYTLNLLFRSLERKATPWVGLG
jgi:NitT/TauT family transport system permease protein